MADTLLIPPYEQSHFKLMVGFLMKSTKLELQYSSTHAFILICTTLSLSIQTSLGRHFPFCVVALNDDRKFLDVTTRLFKWDYTWSGFKQAIFRRCVLTLVQRGSRELPIHAVCTGHESKPQPPGVVAQESRWQHITTGDDRAKTGPEGNKVRSRCLESCSNHQMCWIVEEGFNPC